MEKKFILILFVVKLALFFKLYSFLFFYIIYFFNDDMNPFIIVICFFIFKLYLKGNLKHFLDDVGIKMFKEEENKQGVLCKFSKAKFITSNINIINIMLSKNFTNTLKKINTIEISKASK